MPTTPTTPNPGTTGRPNPVDLSRMVKSLANPGVSNPVTGYSTFFLMEDGTVKSGGYANIGRLGIGDHQPHIVRPMTISYQGQSPGPAKAVYYGGDSLKVLTEAGEIWSWGYNGNGEVGDSTNVQRNFPVPLNWGANAMPVITQMSSTGNGLHTSATSWYAIDSNANLWVWGYNGYGQLGLGNVTNNYNAPYKTALPDVVDVTGACGFVGTAFATTANGDVYAAGYNNRGQAGTGGTAQVNSWTKLNLPGPCKKVSTSGYYDTTYGSRTYALFLLEDGTVYATGYNGSYECGNSTTINITNGPEQIVSLNKITNIWTSGGLWGSSFASDIDGNFYAWGFNTYGSLGLGDTTHRATPTLHPLKNIASVSIGGNYSYQCVTLLTTDGKVYSAGHNTYGPCGLGKGGAVQSTHELMHMAPEIQGNVVEISHYGNSQGIVTQVLDKNGDAWSCGHNSNHMLCSIPTSTDRIYIPAKVMF